MRHPRPSPRRCVTPASCHGVMVLHRGVVLLWCCIASLWPIVLLWPRVTVGSHHVTMPSCCHVIVMVLSNRVTASPRHHVVLLSRCPIASHCSSHCPHCVAVASRCRGVVASRRCICRAAAGALLECTQGLWRVLEAGVRAAKESPCSVPLLTKSKVSARCNPARSLGRTSP